MQRPLAGLTRRNVGRELMAGVTLLAIAIPLNIGYAQIAGLPPTAGLYALVVPAVVYALSVSSRQVVASPDAAAAALVASSIGGLAVAGSADYATLALAQAILCGVMFLLLAVFKLGFLANFLSKPILVGFVGGLALDILVSQVAKMLGREDRLRRRVRRQGRPSLFAGLDTVNWWSVLISAARWRCSCSAAASRAGCRGRSSCWSSPPSWWSSPTSTTPASPCSATVAGRSAHVDLAGDRLDDVAGARPVGDRAHAGDDGGGPARLALVRREAQLPDEPQSRPVRLRRRQRRRRGDAASFTVGSLDLAHRGDGPGRLPHAAARRS